MLGIAIELIFGLNYALKRWRFLELVKPGLWLARMPIIGPYMSKALGVQRDFRQVTNFNKTLKRYGIESDQVLKTGNTKNQLAKITKGVKPDAKAGPGLKGLVPESLQNKFDNSTENNNQNVKKEGLLSRIWQGSTQPEEEPTVQPLSREVLVATAAYLNAPSVVTAVENGVHEIRLPSDIQNQQLENDLIPADNERGDVLIVTIPQEDDQYIPALKQSLIVGSGEDCDIRLNNHGVGERHLRLDRTDFDWTVTDLGAVGGTYLDSSQLLSNVPEVWSINYPLKIGAVSIRMRQMTASEFAAIFDQRPQEAPGITIFPPEQTCEAGQTSVWQAHVTNQGKTVEHFGVFVSGIEPEWIQLEAMQKPLMPGESAVVAFSIAPPRHFSATAGNHHGAVRVQAISDSSVFSIAEFRLTILPFESWQSELSHHQLFAVDNDAHLQVQNLSNHMASIDLSADIAHGDFAIDPLPETSSHSLEAGETLAVPVSVTDLKRPWFGRVRNEPFTINSVAADGEFALQHPGIVQIKPIIPLWVVSVLGFILPFACLFATMTYTYVENRNAAATATAEALAAANLALIPTATPIATSTPRPIVLPNNCRTYKSYQEQLGNGPDPDEGWLDGEIELYANRDPRLPMTIYCHDMASNAPQEYISLINIGEPFNFSSYTFPDGTITTVFSKIRVNPITLEIDGTDRAFAEIVDSRVDQVLDNPDFGRTKGCTINENISVSGTANINLEGTQFSIAADLDFRPFGKELGDHLVEFSSQNQILNLQVNGNCGWLYQSGPLRLWLNDVQE